MDQRHIVARSCPPTASELLLSALAALLRGQFALGFSSMRSRRTWCVREFFHVRQRDFARQDGVIAGHIGLRVVRSMLELDVIPVRNCSRSKRCQSTPIASPMRLASSMLVRRGSLVIHSCCHILCSHDTSQSSATTSGIACLRRPAATRLAAGFFVPAAAYFRASDALVGATAAAVEFDDLRYQVGRVAPLQSHLRSSIIWSRSWPAPAANSTAWPPTSSCTSRSLIRRARLVFRQRGHNAAFVADLWSTPRRPAHPVGQILHFLGDAARHDAVLIVVGLLDCAAAVGLADGARH